MTESCQKVVSTYLGQSGPNIQNAGHEPHAEAGICGMSAMKRP